MPNNINPFYCRVLRSTTNAVKFFTTASERNFNRKDSIPIFEDLHIEGGSYFVIFHKGYIAQRAYNFDSWPSISDRYLTVLSPIFCLENAKKISYNPWAICINYCRRAFGDLL